MIDAILLSPLFSLALLIAVLVMLCAGLAVLVYLGWRADQ